MTIEYDEDLDFEYCVTLNELACKEAEYNEMLFELQQDLENTELEEKFLALRKEFREKQKAFLEKFREQEEKLAEYYSSNQQTLKMVLNNAVTEE